MSSKTPTNLPPPSHGDPPRSHLFSRYAAAGWLCCLFLISIGLAAHAQQFPKLTWTKFVGTPGGGGFTDGPKVDARICNPLALMVDGTNTAYIMDDPGAAGIVAIRLVSPTGIRMVTLGDISANSMYVDSAGTIYIPDGTSITSSGAVLTGPALGLNMVKDSSGNIFRSEPNANVIYKRTPAGVETVFAGSFGAYGFVQGTGASARFSSPQQMAIDTSGNLYVSDQNGNAIRKITPAGVVSSLTGAAAGAPNPRNYGSVAWGPVSGVAAGMVYMVNNTTTVYKISASSTTGTTTALSLSAANAPELVATDATGRLYLIDRNPNGTANTTNKISYRLRRFPTQVSNTSSYTSEAAYGPVAGSVESPGLTNNTTVGGVAKFSGPQGVAVNATTGEMYIADTENRRIRKVTSAGITTTYAGDGTNSSVDTIGTESRLGASFEEPNSLTVAATGDVYVTDRSAVRRIKATGTTGLVKTLATSTTSGVNYRGIAVSGNPVVAVYVGLNHEVIKLTLSGTDTWTASSFFNQIPADRRIKSLSFDASGRLYVGIGGGTTYGTYGTASVIQLDTAGAATILMPAGYNADGLTSGTPPPGYTQGGGNADGILAFDGGAFITDTANHTVRKLLEPDPLKDYPYNTYWSVGTIGGYMGSRTIGFLADVGEQAAFDSPVGITSGLAGEVYISDQYNHSVFKGVLAGPVFTIKAPALTSTTAASVSAEVLPQGGSLTITSTGVEYGLTADYGSTATTTSSTATGVRVDTASLSPLNTANAYHYRFRATMSNGVNYYSADALLPSGAVISSFTGQVTSANATSMTVTLNPLCQTAISNMSIEIQRSTDNVNFTTIATAASTLTTYEDTVPITPGLTYYYRLRATSGSYASAWSNVVQLQQPPIATASSISGTVLFATEPEMGLRLNSSITTIYTDAQKEIQRSTDGSNYTTVAIIAASNYSYDETVPLNGDPNLRYYYRVRAVVGSFISVWSNVAVVQQPARPTAGVSLSSVLGAIKILVTGSDQQLVPSDLTHFPIERSPNGTTWTPVGADLVYSSDNKTAYDYTVTTAGTYYYRIKLLSGSGPWETSWNPVPATRSTTHFVNNAKQLGVYAASIGIVLVQNVPVGLTLSTSAERSVDGGTAAAITLLYNANSWGGYSDQSAPFGLLQYTLSASGGFTAAGDPYVIQWQPSTALNYPTVTAQNLEGGGTGFTLNQQYFVAGSAQITASALRSTDGGTPVSVNLQYTSAGASLTGFHTDWYIDLNPPEGTNVYTLSLNNVYGWTGTVPDVSVVTPASPATLAVTSSLTSINVVLHDDVSMNPEITFNINASTTASAPGTTFRVQTQRSLTSTTQGFSPDWSQSMVNPNPVFTDSTPVVNAPMDLGATSGRGINYYIRAMVYAYDADGHLTGTRASSAYTVYVPAPTP